MASTTIRGVLCAVTATGYSADSTNFWSP